MFHAVPDFQTTNFNFCNQLVRENSVTQNKTVVYEYDNRGNITSKKTYAYTAGEITGTPTDEVVYSYNNSQWKDMLTAYDGENITYDDIGNPITYRNGISLTWKNGRRLASYTDGVYNITYNYTDGGIRKNKTVNGETTEYLLSGSQIMQERRPNGDILNYARDESGGLVGFDYYSAAENVINFYYYLKNMQGDIVGITDRQGNVLVTYTYDTWGKLISITGSMANTIGIINPFRYRGYYYDTETGFYYVSRRYYDPEIGRWLNADGQISGVGGEVLGYNMFAYCMNNPVNMSDPSGNWPRWITAAVTVVAAVVTVAAVATGNFVVAAVAATVTIAAGAAYIAQSAHYDRREAKNDVATLPKSPSDATKAGWINSNPKSDLNPNGGGPKATLHQYTSTNNSNVKYVSPDGHREVIYNSKNEIVLDARDSGTYNFCPSDEFWYSNASIGHLFHEIIPWVIFGNSDDDPGPIINQIICLFE